MPALKIFEGEAPDPQRGPGEGLLFDRLPCSARKDPRIGKGAKLLLAAIVPRGGPWPQWVERTDGWLSDETGQSTTAIGRNLKELETAGWIQRVRRRNHRKIYLLFDLAGRMQSPDSVNAITKNGECTPHFRVMHSPDSGTPCIRERERKILRSEGGSPSPTSPKEGGSTTTTPTASEKTQATDHNVQDVTTWTEADARGWETIRDDPRQPFRGLAAKLLAEYHRFRAQRTEEGSQATGPPVKESRLPGLRDENPVRDDSTKFDASGQRE
jgi:hypothetical protein